MPQNIGHARRDMNYFPRLTHIWCWQIDLTSWHSHQPQHQFVFSTNEMLLCSNAKLRPCKHEVHTHHTFSMLVCDIVIVSVFEWVQHQDLLPRPQTIRLHLSLVSTEYEVCCRESESSPLKYDRTCCTNTKAQKNKLSILMHHTYTMVL